MFSNVNPDRSNDQRHPVMVSMARLNAYFAMSKGARCVPTGMFLGDGPGVIAAFGSTGKVETQVQKLWGRDSIEGKFRQGAVQLSQVPDCANHRPSVVFASATREIKVIANAVFLK